jgi:hypothetical protein
LAEFLPSSAVVVMASGQVIFGGSRSTTDTWKVHELVSPALSTTDTLTGVLPSWKREPLVGLSDTDATPQLSLALAGAQVTTASARPASALSVTSLGHVTAGTATS